MKILTIRQPHVGAIFLGLKPWETRSKPTSYRGELGIHAAARVDVDRLAKLGLAKKGWEWAMSVRSPRCPEIWETGVIIGVAELVDCVPTENVPQGERDWGDFSPGRWAWRLKPIRLLAVSIVAPGSLSFWKHDVPTCIDPEQARATSAGEHMPLCEACRQTFLFPRLVRQ